MEQPTDQSRYSKKYYRENRLKIAEKKRERYLNDPEYREAILSRARERRQRVLLEKQELAAKKAKRKDSFQDPAAFQVMVGGKLRLISMFTSGQLAMLLGRKTQTIRLWEKKGIIPPALYRSFAKDRLYTFHQVRLLSEAYQRCVEKFGRKAETRISETTFPEDAKKIWEQFPAGVDE